MNLPFFGVILLYALFASVFIIEKTSLHYAEPLFSMGCRMELAGLLMLLLHFLLNKNSFKIEKKHLSKLFLLAFFNIYLTNGLEAWSLSQMPAFKACFIYSLSPFAAAFLSYLIFSERLSLKKCLGLTIGFLGIIPLLLEKTALERRLDTPFLFSLPEIAMLIAMISNVYGWILMKQLVDELSYPFLVANGLSMALGGVMALIHSFVLENWNPSPIVDYKAFISCSLLMIGISNFLCYNLYGILLKRFSATFMSFAGFITQLFTPLFGNIFLKEAVPPLFYLSFVIVFSGLFIFSQEEIKKSQKTLAVQ
jgi:drug/metabolite transporter (DMT)-like permease